MEERAKRFDAVRMMRDIRDALGEEIRGMSSAEELAFLRGRLRERKPSGTAEPAVHRERDASRACRTSSRRLAPSRRVAGTVRPLDSEP